jgi:acyl dehydratase
LSMAMNEMSFERLQVGDEIPALTTDPIKRVTLALFAGASGDHNPIHVDLDFAREAGMDDVFVHGMFSMACIGRLLTNWAPPQALRQFKVRFVAIAHVHDRLTCSGSVLEKFESQGEKLVRLRVTAVNQESEIKVIGEAVVALV